MRLPERRRDRVLLVVGIAVALTVWVLVSRNLGDIDLEQLLRDVSGRIGDWTYLIVGAFAFLETGAFVGLVVPGETVVVLGGAVAGQGETNVLLTLAIVWVAAFGGDSASYLIGRKLGRDFVLEHGPRIRITRERFARVERYFEDHGGKTILIGRFIGIVRALAPFVAGSSAMRYRDMVPFSVLGTGIWAATFTLLGYYASRNLNEIVEAADRYTFVFGLVVALIVGAIVAVRYLRVPRNRERVVSTMERRGGLRALVSLGRRVGPQARFLGERLTPGGLGLEFTATLAALAVSLYVLIAYAIVVGEGPGPTPGDGTAFDIAEALRSGWLTDVMRVITELGSGPVAIAVAAVALVGFCIWRRWPELIGLVVGMAIIVVAVPELKDAIGRPRPPGPLVSGASGDAYPSGHAAYAILYPWLALTATIRLRPGLPGGTALIVGGIALAGLVGLSRVYLRIHYLSDVSGGWALGIASFSLVAALVLVAVHLRQNQRGDDSDGRDTT